MYEISHQIVRFMVKQYNRCLLFSSSSQFGWWLLLLLLMIMIVFNVGFIFVDAKERQSLIGRRGTTKAEPPTFQFFVLSIIFVWLLWRTARTLFEKNNA